MVGDFCKLVNAGQLGIDRKFFAEAIR